MAKIDIQTTVTAPAQITIPLVRADHASTANIFRVCFEVFLSLFSTFIGYFIGLPQPTNFHWVVLAFTGISAFVFLMLSFQYGRAAKVE